MYNLQTPITNVLGMTIGSVEIPLSGYYAFSDKYGNTTFEVLIDSEPITCLRIPEGNYDSDTLTSTIQTMMNEKIFYQSSQTGYNFLPMPTAVTSNALSKTFNVGEEL